MNSRSAAPCAPAAGGPARVQSGSLAPPKRRAAWIDSARGLIIVLVVFGHSVAGLLDAKLLDPHSFWSQLYPQLHTFRMPAFFLLCGLFVQVRLRSGLAVFSQDIATRIAWPYLLWGGLQLAVIGLMGSMVNTPVDLDWQRFAGLLWDPPSQFWFLHTLVLFHLLALACAAVGRPWLLYLVCGGAVLLKLAADHGGSAVAPLLAAVPTALLEEHALFLACYALGVALGPRLVADRSVGWHFALPCAGALGVWLWLLGPTLAQTGTPLSWTTLACTVAGIAACLTGVRLPPVQRSRWLQAIGRHSLSILVLHVFFMAGLRIVLTRWLGVDAPLLLLPLMLVAGVAGPLLVYDLARRFGVVRGLGLS